MSCHLSHSVARLKGNFFKKNNVSSNEHVFHHLLRYNRWVNNAQKRLMLWCQLTVQQFFGKYATRILATFKEINSLRWVNVIERIVKQNVLYAS